MRRLGVEPRAKICKTSGRRPHQDGPSQAGTPALPGNSWFCSARVPAGDGSEYVEFCHNLECCKRLSWELGVGSEEFRFLQNSRVETGKRSPLHVTLSAATSEVAKSKGLPKQEGRKKDGRISNPRGTLRLARRHSLAPKEQTPVASGSKGPGSFPIPIPVPVPVWRFGNGNGIGIGIDSNADGGMDDVRFHPKNRILRSRFGLIPMSFPRVSAVRRRGGAQNDRWWVFSRASARREK